MKTLRDTNAVQKNTITRTTEVYKFDLIYKETCKSHINNGHLP